jgi:DinB family protein
MTNDESLRKHLVNLLQARQAHMMFDDAVADFPPEMMNAYPPNVPYTPWHLIEHLRITQWDILDYMRNPNYKEIEWPKDYWPARDAKTDQTGWDKTVAQFRSDMQAIVDIVNDPKTDFFAPILHGYDGHTILREVMLVADHNAYHVGELAILRQVMGAWPKNRKM